MHVEHHVHTQEMVKNQDGSVLTLEEGTSNESRSHKNPRHVLSFIHRLWRAAVELDVVELDVIELDVRDTFVFAT